MRNAERPVNLELPALPEGWTPRRAGERLIIDVAPGSHIVFDAMRPLPEDQDAWRERVLREGVAGEITIVRTSVPALERGGWAVTAVESIEESTGRHRLHVFYPLLHWGTFAAFICDDSRELERHAPMVSLFLLNAVPEFPRGFPACIAELWDGLEER